jgi:small-conductance mechanosensitive channel
MLHFLPQILGTLAVIIITVVLKIGLNILINQYRKSHSQPTVNTSYVKRVLNLIINTLAIIAIMILWGVEPDNLFLALGSVFAVIGVALFAQWSILSNITSGIILFFSAPFRVGDYIKFIDNDLPIEAMVEDIFTFYTHLRTKDGVLHILPNTLLLQKAIAVIESKDDNHK